MGLRLPLLTERLVGVLILTNYTLMRNLFLILLLTISTLSYGQCFYEGKIDYNVVDDSLEIFFTEYPDACLDTFDIEVKWVLVCNPFNQQEQHTIDITDIEDTIKVSSTGWKAIWAISKIMSYEFNHEDSLFMSSNHIIHIGNNAPVAEVNFPNPNNGNFQLNMLTNATKQYVRIIGPWGMIYSKWHYGSSYPLVQILPFNPNGQYTIIIDWFFDDDCLNMARTRHSFIKN